MLSGFDNPIHLLLLFGVVLMVFGAKRLPEVGRGLGSGIRGFRDSLLNPDEPAQSVTDAQVSMIPVEQQTPRDAGE
jgi:sec-independent protein translocase protein TatA